MPLDAATILALAATCAPDVAPTTLLAVARAESALDPLAIGVNGGGMRPARARTAAEARRRAEALIAAGRDIDLGLGQINVRNLSWLGLSLSDAFDPCRNLAASARVLSHGYRRAAAAGASPQAALRTALSLYNTGSPTRGVANGYVARVTAMATPASAHDLPPPGPAGPSEPTPAAQWQVFGPAGPTSSSFVITLAGAQP